MRIVHTLRDLESAILESVQGEEFTPLKPLYSHGKAARINARPFTISCIVALPCLANASKRRSVVPCIDLSRAKHVRCIAVKQVTSYGYSTHRDAFMVVRSVKNGRRTAIKPPPTAEKMSRMSATTNIVRFHNVIDVHKFAAMGRGAILYDPSFIFGEKLKPYSIHVCNIKVMFDRFILYVKMQKAYYNEKKSILLNPGILPRLVHKYFRGGLDQSCHLFEIHPAEQLVYALNHEQGEIMMLITSDYRDEVLRGVNREPVKCSRCRRLQSPSGDGEAGDSAATRAVIPDIYRVSYRNPSGELRHSYVSNRTNICTSCFPKISKRVDSADNMDFIEYSRPVETPVTYKRFEAGLWLMSTGMFVADRHSFDINRMIMHDDHMKNADIMVTYLLRIYYTEVT